MLARLRHSIHRRCNITIPRRCTITTTTTTTTTRRSSISTSSNPHPPLTPAAIHHTLSTLPSDSLILTFFLSSARQPHYFHSPLAFDLALRALRRLSARLPSLPALLRTLPISPKPQTLLLLLRLYWRGTMHAEALHLFDEMPKYNFIPNTFTRNIVMDILFKDECGDAAMRFFRETVSPNFLTFNIALRYLCCSGDLPQVCCVLRQMVRSRFCLNTGTYSVVFDCFRKSHSLQLQQQTLCFMIVTGERGTVGIWTILIDGLCRGRRVDMASKVLGVMEDAGCAPNVVTYTTLIKGLSKAGMYEEVSVVFSTMVERGCEPDLVLYNVLIDCMTKARRFGDAVEAYCDLRRRKIVPDAYTLSSLMSLLCSSGRMRLLPRLLSGLDVTFDLVACNSLLSFLCKAGLPSQTVELYREMIDKGFTPDYYSIVGLLSSLCEVGMVDYAVNVYRSIALNSPDIDPYVHSAMLNGLVKRGDYHGAMRLFTEAVSGNYNLDVVSYTVAIHGLFQGYNFDSARNLFYRMKLSGVVPNICTYNVMIRGLCKARDITAVQQLVDEMGVAGIQMDYISFNTIIRHLLKVHRVRQGILLFMKMCDLSMKPSRKTYLQMLDVLVHARDGEADDLLPKLTYYLEDPTIVGCFS